MPYIQRVRRQCASGNVLIMYWGEGCWPKGKGKFPPAVLRCHRARPLSTVDIHGDCAPTWLAWVPQSPCLLRPRVGVQLYEHKCKPKKVVPREKPISPARETDFPARAWQERERLQPLSYLTLASSNWRAVPMSLRKSRSPWMASTI